MIEKMHHEVDHIVSQDNVRHAKSHLQTVGENVRKLGLNVMNELPLSAFLVSKANSAFSFGRYPVIKPEIRSNVTDTEAPADAKTKQLATEELMNPSLQELRSTSADLPFCLTDDNLSYGNSEANVADKLKVEEHCTSVASEFTCSDESSLQVSLSNLAKEVDDEAQKERVSSPGGYESARTDGEDAVESLSTDNNQEDADDLSMRIPFSLTTNGSLSDLPQEAETADPSPECASDISTVVSSSELAFSVASYLDESKKQEAIPLSGSLLLESFDVVEVSLSELANQEGQTSDYVYSNRRESYLNNSNSSSSVGTLSMDSAGQSNNSVDATEDLLMETIDLFDEVKLDRTSALVENDMNLSSSYRRGSLNPCKKMFPNRFASKKRLEKDYKLLAIWHGDIDKDFSQLTWNNRTSGPILQDNVKNSTAKDLEDSDWEMI